MSDTNLQKKKLLLSDCIRVIITYIILLLNIPDFVKIFLIMISDTLDCGVPVLLLDDWIDCNRSAIYTNHFPNSDWINKIKGHLKDIFEQKSCK